ncbi:MAG: YceD family protein [Lachnospiraceae bacterium]
MKINLTEFFQNDGKKKEFKENVPMSSFIFLDEEYKIYQKEPLVFTIANVAKQTVQVFGKCSISTKIPCSRCLEEQMIDIEVTFDHTISSPEKIQYDEEQVEGQDFMEGFDLLTDKILIEELQLCWPSKILCNDSCKGICFICGQNKNEIECNCDDFIPDPRWMGLKDILENN